MTISLEFPGGPVPLNSPFYIERPPMEEMAQKEVEQPGSVIRIKAPSKMGKSSLFTRIIANAQDLGYKTVSLDFKQVEESVFANLDKFLRWFCANISRQLGLKPMLDDYWDRDMGSKVSCTIYFEAYLLEQLNSPLVLTLNEVNRVFEHPKIAQEFLPLLRFWHEQAKQVQTFSKLRLVVVHSTEIYVSLNLHQSPFNVGLPVKLPEFTLEQIQELALLYGLDWAEGELGKHRLAPLQIMVGGHPYLIRVALYYLCKSKLTLEELLQKAPTQEGIYSDYLRTHLAKVGQDPELTAALKKLIAAKQSIQLQPILAYKLESMGLVKLNGDQCTLSCQLYRLYFEAQNLKLEYENHGLIKKLRRENEKLKDLINIDPLTQIPNRRHFDSYLQTEWRRTARERIPLSLIIVDIDCFKLYNDTYGHQMGDLCIQQVAQAIKDCLKRPGDLPARYGGEEFAIILPNVDARGAVYIAEKIRNQIKALAIDHLKSKISLGMVTASFGVASTISQSSQEPTLLVREADLALYQSKEKGRDRVTLSSILNFRLSSGDKSLESVLIGTATKIDLF